MLKQFRKLIPTFVFPVFLFVMLPFVRMKSTLDPGLTPRFLVAAIFCFLFFTGLIIRKDKTEFSRMQRIVMYVLAAQLSWMLITVLWSVNRGDALAEWSRLATVYLFFPITLIFLNRAKDPDKIIPRVSLLSMLIFSCFAVFQLIELWQKDLLENRPFVINLSIGSTLGNKNFFAEVLFMLLPLQLYGLWTEQGRWRVFFLMSTVICLTWLILLQTLATWLGLLSGGLCALLICLSNPSARELIPLNRLEFRKKRMFFLIILFALSGMIFLLSKTGNVITVEAKLGKVMEYWNDRSLLDSTSQQNENSIYERLMIWRNSFSLIKEHPLLGAGLNNWKIEHAKYGIGGTGFLNSGGVHFEHPHNDYLLVWSEQGPMGLLLYLSFFFLLFNFSFNQLKSVQSVSKKKFLILIIFGISGFMVMSFFAYPRSRIYVMLLLMVQTAWMMKFSYDHVTDNGNRKRSAFIYGIFAMMSLFGILTAAFRISGEVHVGRAQTAQMAKNYARMLREANKGNSYFFPLDLASTPVPWYAGLAKFYSGNIKDAQEEFEKAILINPYHINVLNDLATCYEQNKNHEDAITCYKRTLAITPGFVEGLLNLSAAYYNLQEIDSAFYYISRIREKRLDQRGAQNLKLYRSAILYGMAAGDSLKFANLNERNSFLQFIDNDSLLYSVYIETKNEKVMFLKQVHEQFLKKN